MEKLSPSDMLNFNPGQLTAVRNTFGYSDVKKLNQDIDIFEDWIRKQNHFVIREFDRDYLERLLIYNKGFIERAKKRFDSLCTLRNLMPEFLRDFDVKHEFVHLFNCSTTCILPKPTPDNCRIAISRIYGNEEKVELLHMYRYLVVYAEYILTHDYCVGHEVIADTRDIEFGMLSKLNPIIIQKALYLLIEAMGLRLRRIHFISGSKFLDALIAVVKRGLTKKLTERLKVHSSYDTLYEYVPREILPVDFGGDEKSIKELSELNFKVLSSDSHIERMKFMEQAATDESCRLTSTFNEEYSGMPGSFKSLCVD